MSGPVAGASRRIVLVTNGLTRAGAETQLMHLATALRRRGDDVGLVSILPTDAYADRVAALEIPVAHLRLRPPVKGASAIRSGAQVLRAWQPDAVISFVYQANVLGRLAGRMAHVPVVISSVRNEYFGGRSRELILRATDRLATVTTTNSAGVAESLVRRNIVPAERLVVIPNGVDLAPLTEAAADRASARAGLGIPVDRFVWLAAGRLEEQKDYPTLLAALGRCADAGIDHGLLIAGKGVLQSQLERMAADLGIADRVQFLGVRDDVPRLMAAADAVVLASRFEGLPNVVMEAMAAAKPVVATRVGGTAELVADGVTGRLVGPGDPEGLAAAMVATMRIDEADRRAMGAAGRAVISERYSVGAAEQQWLALLDRCLAGAQPTARRSRAPLSAAVPGAVT